MSFCRPLLVLVIAALVCFSSLGVAGEKNQTLKLHFISGSKEYESERSLKAFQEHLESKFAIEVTASWASDGAAELQNLASLADADCLVIFSRRLKLGEEQMKMIRRHWEAGKPVIGIRTAGHAFQKDDNAVLDHDVFGGNYQGHFGDEAVKVTTTDAGKSHPVLANVGAVESKKLYKAGPLGDDTIVLQIGEIEKGKQPVTFVHSYRGGRMFFTALGVPEDFANPNFVRLLENAVFWTCDRPRENRTKRE